MPLVRGSVGRREYSTLFTHGKASISATTGIREKYKGNRICCNPGAVSYLLERRKSMRRGISIARRFKSSSMR
jgi:hypothetical protein